MATFPINPADIVQFTVFQDYQNSRLLNIWHYQVTADTPVQSDGAAVMTNMINEFETLFYGAGGAIPALTHSTLAYRQIRGQVVFPTRRFYVPKLLNYSGSGGAALTPLPSDTQLRVTLRNATPGRGVNGGKSFGGLTTSDMTGAVWNVGARSVWQSNVADHVVDELSNPPETWHLQPVVWNARDPLTPGEIAVGIVQEEVRVMRRRQFRIGI